MVIKPFSQRIDPEQAFQLQNAQYMERLLMQVTVPAGQSTIGQVGVSNLGHFFCMFVTGSFSTLAMPAAAIVDNGVSYLAGQLIDGAGQRKLFNDRIPLDLWLSPGRRKDATSTTVLTDPGSNSLFYPIELEYLFTANSTIILDVVNTSNTPNYLEICFHGIRCISSMTQSGRDVFANQAQRRIPRRGQRPITRGQ
ncbi:MAG: hypothetical protein WC390_11910 [Sulfurimonas sp.]|jgi:hypothetical protein